MFISSSDYLKDLSAFSFPIKKKIHIFFFFIFLKGSCTYKRVSSYNGLRIMIIQRGRNLRLSRKEGNIGTCFYKYRFSFPKLNPGHTDVQWQNSYQLQKGPQVHC